MSGINDLPVPSLSDEQVLAFCDAQMDQGSQEKLSRLLELNREGTLVTQKGNNWMR